MQAEMQKVDYAEVKIIELNISRNNLDQCIRRNTTEIQRIPASVLEDHLEDKVLDNCKSVNLIVEHREIEGCHRIGNANQKFCNLFVD